MAILLIGHGYLKYVNDGNFMLKVGSLCVHSCIREVHFLGGKWGKH